MTNWHSTNPCPTCSHMKQSKYKVICGTIKKTPIIHQTLYKVLDIICPSFILVSILNTKIFTWPRIAVSFISENVQHYNLRSTAFTVPDEMSNCMYLRTELFYNVCLNKCSKCVTGESDEIQHSPRWCMIKLSKWKEKGISCTQFQVTEPGTNPAQIKAVR
jgi:hypothetical protein